MVPCLKVLQHRGVLQCPVPVPAVALHRRHIEVGIFLRSWVNFSAIILEYFRCTSNMFILLIYFSFDLICSACKPNQSPRLRTFSRFHGGSWWVPTVFFNTPKMRLFSRCRLFRWKCWLWACLFQPWRIQRFFAWGLRTGVSGLQISKD